LFVVILIHMKISEKLKQINTSISFEFFPPKTPEAEKQLFQTIKDLEPLKPTFVSVTYGAGGSTRDRTRNIVKRIHEETNLTVMAHLTCIGHKKKELIDILQDYKNIGIENILALRGDIPISMENFELPEDGCRYAVELVRLIKENFSDYFCIAVAAYPEGPFMCGATIPEELVKRLEAVEDKTEEVKKIGIEYATEQCIDLLKHGVKGLHFYTLNKSDATIQIYNNIKHLIKN